MSSIKFQEKTLEIDESYLSLLKNNQGKYLCIRKLHHQESQSFRFGVK